MSFAHCGVRCRTRRHRSMALRSHDAEPRPTEAGLEGWKAYRSRAFRQFSGSEKLPRRRRVAVLASIRSCCQLGCN